MNTLDRPRMHDQVNSQGYKAEQTGQTYRTSAERTLTAWPLLSGWCAKHVAHSNSTTRFNLPSNVAGAVSRDRRATAGRAGGVQTALGTLRTDIVTAAMLFTKSTTKLLEVLQICYVLVLILY
ncbi:hypothetical protein CBL_14577 [Carabus blaptoides fortunei]